MFKGNIYKASDSVGHEEEIRKKEDYIDLYSGLGIERLLFCLNGRKLICGHMTLPLLWSDNPTHRWAPDPRTIHRLIIHLKCRQVLPLQTWVGCTELGLLAGNTSKQANKNRGWEAMDWTWCWALKVMAEHQFFNSEEPQPCCWG